MTTPKSPGAAGSTRWRSLGLNLLLAAFSIALTLVVGELSYRWILFHGGEELGQSLRKPGLYADFAHEDAYWLLQHRWANRYQPPANPHSLLGWTGTFDPETLEHRESPSLGGRRPVLLYGDSFAQGVSGAKSFQAILNADPDFSAGHYLLNYGVGGYGLDQILLLMEKTVDLYEDPYIVFSFLTYDINRSMLSVRTGQKPYFELVDDELVLRGVPIDSDPDRYFASRSPEIHSYLWRRVLFIRGRPANALIAWLRGTETKERRQRELNSRLLARAFDTLASRDLDSTVLLFHPKRSLRGRGDWKDAWLEQVLSDSHPDVILAVKTLHEQVPEASIDDLILPRNGHPTTLYNRLIADQIRRRVLTDGDSP